MSRKKKFLLGLVLASIYLCYTDISHSSTGNEIYIELSEKKTIEKIECNDLDGMNVYVKSFLNQYLKNGGLVFSLHIENSSNNDVQLINPLDSVTILMLNENKESMIPYYEHRIKSCTKSSELRDINLPLNILQIVLNGVELTNKEHNQKLLVINANSSFEVHFEVNKVQNLEDTLNNLINISSGKYYVTVLQSLIIPQKIMKNFISNEIEFEIKDK